MKKLSIALGFLLTFVGVNAMAASAPPAKVEFTSPKKAIFVKQEHPQFTITLQSNPTTGFSWFLSKYNQNLVEVISQKYVAPSSKLMGAPGYEVWTFQVTDAGFKVPQTMKIEMSYARPWEKKVGKATAFRVFTR